MSEERKISNVANLAQKKLMGPDQKVEELIMDCIHLQQEIGLLTPIVLFLSPSFNIQNTMEPEMSNLGRLKIRDKLEQFSSPGKIKFEYLLSIRELENKLGNLAELLEEEEFDLNKFRCRLTEDQYDWLVSHKKEIKKHLRGIELK
ncbi:MAG: hypothetical protein HXY44_06535 [Syntrophaceae bacterium]|nr:hypothetical protein [Syntrophaceae bacterium]